MPWLAESAKVKVSAFTELQEYDMPQLTAASTTRGALALVVLASTGEKKFAELVRSNAGEKFTGLACATAGRIAIASTRSRTRPTVVLADERLEVAEEQNRIGLRVICLPRANGAPPRA